MRAAEGGAVGRVGGREGGAVLEGGETYASAGGHSDYYASSEIDRWRSETCGS